MNKLHVVIVGAGQLGSRHLQALALSELAMDVSVVDPSEASLDMAKNRYQQIRASAAIGKVGYYTSLENIEKNIDVCVVATNAKHRLGVLQALVEGFIVNNIVFEKVLFQSVKQLQEASTLLRTAGINAWVNCPRRMFPVYKVLEETLAGNKGLSMSVKGNNWGLACNAIHFIDLWSMLSGAIDYNVDLSQLDRQVIDSQRLGYKELSGTINGSSERHSFSLNCQVDKQSVSVEVSFDTDEIQIVVDETSQYCVVTNKRTGKKQTVDYQVVYQSSLTHLVVQSLIETGDCQLTPYQESAALHTPMLSALLPFFIEHVGVEYQACPIT